MSGNCAVIWHSWTSPGLNDCDLDEVDPWTQETLYEIPPERRYRVGSHCVDVESLHEAILKGETTNPYDRTPLDTAAINKRHDYLRDILKENQVSRLRDIPMLTPEQLQDQQLNRIWSEFRYPVPIGTFKQASEGELDRVMDFMDQNYTTRL